MLLDSSHIVIFFTYYKLNKLLAGTIHLKGIKLTLKRLRVSIWTPLSPPRCGFSKNVSSKERLKPWFFATFNVITSHTFTENFIKISKVVQKLWRISLSILAIFIDFHRFFWIYWFIDFLRTKKLTTSVYTDKPKVLVSKYCWSFYKSNLMIMKKANC